MSKELAEKSLQLASRDQVLELLKLRKNEIDEAFFNYLLEVSDQHKAAKNYDEAVKPLRISFDSGRNTGNVYFTALSLLYVAYVEIDRQRFDKCVNMIEQCISECNKVSDARSTELKANAYYLLGHLQHQQYGQLNEALKSLQTAQDLYRKLQKPAEVARIQSSIEQIQQQSIAPGTTKPLSDVLNEIVRSRDTLVEIQTAIEAGQRTLSDIDDQYAKVAANIRKLHTRQQTLTEENANLEGQITTLQEQLEILRTRIELVLVAQNVPLWAAAVRSEIADGELTSLTLPLLERLRSTSPQYALPLIAEIRARNGIPADRLIDLSELEGEQRLFAGVANSMALEAEDPLDAIEVLLDSWETYLINLGGSAQ
jgi:tetratricopeptide (TPR) repeat protein